MTIPEMRRRVREAFERVFLRGGPALIARRGSVIVMQREDSPTRLERLHEPVSKAYVGNSDEVVGMSWERDWSR